MKQRLSKMGSSFVALVLAWGNFTRGGHFCSVVHEGVSGGKQGDPGVSGADQGPIRGLRFQGVLVLWLGGSWGQTQGRKSMDGPFFRGS